MTTYVLLPGACHGAPDLAAADVQRDAPGATIAVFVDPQNPVDMAIDWIRTGQLGPQPAGFTPGPGEPAGTLLAHKCTGAGSLPIPSTR